MKIPLLPETVRILLTKEFKDLKRDYKTLFTTILMPLIMLPLLGFMSLALITQQPVNIAIVDLDQNNYVNPILNITVESRWLVNNLTYYLRKYGYNVSISNSTNVIQDPNIDLIIVIPRDFALNASSLNTTAKVIVYRKAGYQSAQKAEATVYSVINVFSYNISNVKLKALSRLAGINASVPSLKNPVKAYTSLVTVTGERVTITIEFRNMFARILVLALSFVVSPAAFYVIDGIIGERERKTFEFLLVSPVPVSHVIYAKIIAATVLGIIAALADALGLIGYMVSLGLLLGGNAFILIDYQLLLVHAVTAFFTILSTISIALPFITRTRGIRSASNVASIITTAGLIFFFTGFFIDYVKLPDYILYPLYLIPYVHSILIIQTYILENIVRSFLHILFLVIVSITLLIVSSKTINTEKIIVSQT